MILDDLKIFLVENNIVESEYIKFDYDSSNGNENILINIQNNIPCDLAMRSHLRISVKFKDLEFARSTAFSIYNLLFPTDNFQKAIKINNKIMHGKLNKGPYYSGKDKSQRHIYLLDITLTYNR